VQTEIGGESVPIKPPESIAALRRTNSNATRAHSGSFLNFDGSALPG